MPVTFDGEFDNENFDTRIVLKTLLLKGFSKISI